LRKGRKKRKMPGAEDDFVIKDNLGILIEKEST